MLIHALALALFAAGHQQPPAAAPLSPANLPPSAANRPPALPDVNQPKRGSYTSCGAWPSAEPPGVTYRRFVAVLAGPAKCVFAEVAADGTHAWGYRTGCRITVFSSAGLCVVVATGRDQAESEQVMKLVTDNVDLKAPAPEQKTFGTRDAKLEAGLLRFAFHVESRPMSPVAERYFLPTTGLMLEKRGFKLRPREGTPYLCGAKPDVTDPLAHYMCVLCVCPDDKNAVYVVFSTWTGDQPTDTPSLVGTALVKMLHD